MKWVSAAATAAVAAQLTPARTATPKSSCRWPRSPLSLTHSRLSQCTLLMLMLLLSPSTLCFALGARSSHPLAPTSSPSHCRPQQHRTPIERWVKVAIVVVAARLLLCRCAALRCCCIALGASIQFELFLYVLQRLKQTARDSDRDRDGAGVVDGGAKGAAHSGVARGRRVALGRSLHTLNLHNNNKKKEYEF